MTLRREGDELHRREHEDVRFVPLITARPPDARG